MAPRVLVCLDDNGVAHVLAARLTRDGIDGVVVGKPAALADEAKKGVAAVVLQDRYASGEEGTSLLRRVRIARGDIAPAVVLYVGEIPAQDRHLFEHQWRVQTFLPVNATPQSVADAVRAAAGVTPRAAASTGDRSELDIDVDVGSPSEELAAVLSDSFDDDDDSKTALTVEMSRSQLQRLRRMPAGDPTGPVSTTDLSSDLSHLPPPGGDNDVALDVRANAAAMGSASGGARVRPPGADASVAFSSVAPPTTPGLSIPPSVIAEAVDRLARERASAAAAPARAAATNSARIVDDGKSTDLPSSTTPAGAAEGDAMQIQELQRTQAELKKALLAERKARETAQKRVEELEARLARMGEEPATATQGVPAEGVFEDLRYPALLARCRAEGFTGSIVMQIGGAPRTVFLKDGLPVAFSSSEPGQRIGKLLVAQGRITDEQYMKAATLMVERSIKLTDALVELRLIDAESLAVEQRNTTRDQIIQGFEFVQGRFQTVAGATPDANTSTFDFGPGEIYVQGYRRYAPANEMLATYETLRDKYLVSNARLASHRPKLGLTGDDERFLRLLGEAYTVEEASERCGAATDAVARLLAALQALDLVEEWSPGVEQFRSRLRAERQRHVEDLARVLQEARAREDKLLDAFQKALAGHGSAAAELASTPRASDRRADDARKSGDATASSSAPSSSSLSTSSSSTSSSTMSSPSTSSASTSSWRGDRATSSPTTSTASAQSAARATSSASVPPTPSSSPTTSGAPTTAASSLSTGATPTAASPATSSAATASLAPSSATTSGPATSSGTAASSTAYGAAAASTLSTLAFTEPERSPAERRYREGLVLFEAQKFDEAELALRDAVRESPNHAEYFTALARVLLNNPHYERGATLSVVRPLLDHALALSPDDAEAARLLRSIADFAG